MKKILLIIFLFFLSIALVSGQVAVNGDYRTTGTGNWNNLTTWQFRTSANNWIPATSFPTSTNNVYIQFGHLITVNSTQDAVCKDLNIYNNASALTISSFISSLTFNVNVYGKIRAFTQTIPLAETNTAADGLYTGSGTNTGSINIGLTAMIVTNSTGLLRFVGTTRIITYSTEWGPNGTSNNVEFALDPNNTGTLQNGIKFKNISISSGIISAEAAAIVLSSGTSFIIKNLARLTTARTTSSGSAIAGTNSTTPATLIQIDNGGVLEFTGLAPKIDAVSFTNNGTIVYSGTAQALMIGGASAAPLSLTTAQINATYDSLQISGSGIKTAQSAVVVNGGLIVNTGCTFAMAANILSGTLASINNNGTISTTAGTSSPVPAGKTWGSLFQYANPAGTQTIVAGNYTNLTIINTIALSFNTYSNSGTISISGVFTPTALTTPATVVTGSTIDFNNPTGGQIIPATWYNNLTVSNSSGTTTLAPSGNIKIAGAFTPGSQAFINTTSTIDFNNPTGGQTIAAFSYNNLTISNLDNTSGTNSLVNGGTIYVGGVFTPSTTAPVLTVTGNTFNYNKSTGSQNVAASYYNNLTISNTSGTTTLASSGTIYVAGAFTPGALPFVITTSTVNFNNTTGGQTIPKFNFNNLTVSNSSGNTSVVADTVGVAGSFTPGSQSFNPSSSTFNFNNPAGTQLIPAFYYYNILFSNSTATTYNTLAANINVANSLRLAGKKGLAPGVNNVVYAPNATFYFTESSGDTLYTNSPQWPNSNAPTNVTLDGGNTLIFQPPALAFTFVVSNVQLTGNVATITTSTPHNFSPGNLVTIGGLNNSEYGYILGGTFTLAAGTVSGTNTFTFNLTNADIPITVVTGGVALKNLEKTVTGTLTLDNSGKISINQGNTLRMANGSTIFRNLSAAKINLNNGFLAMGNTVSDKVNITIGNTMLSDNEFAYLTNPGGYGTLKILSGTYTPSGSRTIVDLDARLGTILDLTDFSNFTINGNFLSTGTISGKANDNLIIGGANSGSSGRLLLTPSFQTILSLKINRTGASAEVPLGSSITLNQTLDLTAGSLLDSGYVINVLGTVKGLTGAHVSSGAGKIMMTGANVSTHTFSGGAFTVGNLEINSGSLTITDSTSFNVAKDLTLTSGTYATSTGTSYITTVSGNVLGNSFYTGPGRIKMIGSGKKVHGVNVSNLEIATPDFIYASDTTRISNALILTSGNFRDSGKIVTVSGSIAGPGSHVSYNSIGKIKMLGVGSISVAPVAFGNLEIGTGSLISGITSFNVNNDLTLISGGTIDLNSNIATVLGNVFGTGTQIGGTGKIKMIGSNKTISGITSSNLEIATASTDSILAVGAVNITSALGGLFLTSGKFNDGGNLVTCFGNIYGPATHNSTGSGEIKVTGSGRSVTLYPTLANIEIANSASISTKCAATITGNLLMNGGNLTVGNGNLLTFKNNSTIYRTTGNLNLDTGTVVMGSVSTDLVKVFINGNLQSTNELPGSHIANIDLTINDGFSYTLKSNSKSIRNLNVSNGHLLCLFDSLTRNPYNLTVSDLATISGDFYLDSTQYDFSGNTFGPFKVAPSLIINSSGKLKFGNVDHKTFNSNGLLVLKSRKTGTASVGDVTNGGNNIDNKIIGVASVERYVSNMKYLIGDSIPTIKAWRLLAMPTKHNYQTIKQAWQEGGSLNGNPNPGYGIQLVGFGPTSQLSNAIANGFDTISPAGASIKKYNPVSGAWVPVTSTNMPFETGQAYMVFIRGSRAKTQFNQTPDSTVLREKGTLNVGDTSVTVGTAGGQFVAVANPYPSTINFRLLDTANLAPSLYFYDPRLQTYGGYQTVSSLGWIIPGGGSYGAVDNITSSYIQSSQAFFVRTTSAAGTIGFKERAKVDGSSMTSRATSVNQGMLRTTLFKLQNGNYDLTDGVLHIFDSSYLRAVNDMDAVKMNNLGENLGIKISDKTLAIESRPFLEATDTIFYNLGQVKIASYKFSFAPSNLLQNGLQAFLEDRYLNNSTAISLTGTTDVDFTISNVAGSYAADRFRMVFRQLAPLPVTFIDVKAALQNKSVKINWVVANQLNIKEYRIERSLNGVDFQHIGTTASTANTLQTSYEFFDGNPVIGTNFYRIRSIENDGSGKLSKVVKVAIQNAAPQFVISPNPVGENREIHLKVNELPAGDYTGNLYDYAGKKIESKKWHHEAGEAEIVWKVSSSLPNGNYNLCISNKEMKICESVLIK